MYKPDLRLDEQNPYIISRKLEEDILKLDNPNDPIHEDVLEIIDYISMSVKAIAGKLKMPTLLALYHSHKMHIDEPIINASGESQKDLDIITNSLCKNILQTCRLIGAIVSEEEEKPVILNPHGKYLVCFDPLDGSSNLECNVSVGSIFSIWKRTKDTKLEYNDDLEKEFLRPGSEAIAAVYGFFGASTILMTSYAGVVNGFTLDVAMFLFILSHPNIKVKNRAGIYSVNEANWKKWDTQTKKYVDDFKNTSCSLRYIGSMVSDVHRTLLYGGIFMYPHDSSNPKGKLRLLYECIPMAMMFKNAGGKAISGPENILDIVPSHIHERSGVFMGSTENVNDVWALYHPEE